MANAIYAFSGDPITYGHIDIIERAGKVFDNIIAGIGTNQQKIGKYLFTPEERMEMARRSLSRFRNVTVQQFDGLLVDFAYEHGVEAIVKGVRNPEDFAYESLLHHAGESQKRDVDTFLLLAKPALAHISSGVVKELQRNQGDVREYVPLYVKQCLEAKISTQYLLSITGSIGVGKSRITQQLYHAAQAQGLPVHEIDLDAVGHRILGTLAEPLYVQTRARIIHEFGERVGDADGSINRKQLGALVFDDPSKLRSLNDIMAEPMRFQMYKELRGKEGLVLLNGALIAEAGWCGVSNNNAVIVDADAASQERRLKARGLAREQISRRLASQYTTAEKERAFTQEMVKYAHGRLWTINNSDGMQPDIKGLLDDVVRELKVPYGRYIPIQEIMGQHQCRRRSRAGV